MGSSVSVWMDSVGNIVKLISMNAKLTRAEMVANVSIKQMTINAYVQRVSRAKIAR